MIYRIIAKWAELDLIRHELLVVLLELIIDPRRLLELLNILNNNINVLLELQDLFYPALRMIPFMDHHFKSAITFNYVSILYDMYERA